MKDKHLKLEKLILEQDESWKTSKRTRAPEVDVRSFEAIGDKVFSPLNMELASELGLYSFAFSASDYVTKKGAKMLGKKAMQQAASTLSKKLFTQFATNGLCTVFIHPYAIGTCVFAKNAWAVGEVAYMAGSIGYWYNRGNKGEEKIAWAAYDPTIFMKRQGWVKRTLSDAEGEETGKLAMNYQIGQQSIESNTTLKQEIAIRNARLIAGMPQFQSVKKAGKWQIFDDKERYSTMNDRLEVCGDTHLPHFVTKSRSSEFLEFETEFETWKKALKDSGYDNLDEEALRQIKWPKVRRYLHECLLDEEYIKRFSDQIPALMNYLNFYAIKSQEGMTPEQIWSWASQNTRKVTDPSGEARESDEISSYKQNKSKWVNSPYGCVLGNDKQKFESFMLKLITISNTDDYRYIKDKILKKDRYLNCQDGDFAMIRAIKAFQLEHPAEVQYQKGGVVYIDTGFANQKTIDVLTKKANEIPEKTK